MITKQDSSPPAEEAQRHLNDMPVKSVSNLPKQVEDDEARAEILLLLAQGTNDRHQLSDDDTDHDVPDSDQDISDGCTASTYDDSLPEGMSLAHSIQMARTASLLHNGFHPMAPFNHNMTRMHPHHTKRNRDHPDRHDAPVEGKEDTSAPVKKKANSKPTRKPRSGNTQHLPELTTTSTIPASMPMALHQALLSGYGLNNSMNGNSMAIGGGLLGSLAGNLTQGLPGLSGSFPGGLPATLPGMPPGMAPNVGNPIMQGGDVRYSFMQHHSAAAAHLVSANALKGFLSSGNNMVNLQPQWCPQGNEIGVQQMNGLDYSGFDQISGMLGSPYMSAHGMSDQTMSSNGLSGRLSSHGMSGHGLSAHGITNYELGRIMGQNEGMIKQDQYGSALLDKVQEANRNKRKHKNETGYRYKGLEDEINKPQAGHTQRKPGPPSSRDKVWDLLEEHEKKMMLTDSMSASEGTRLLLERRAKHLMCAVEEIPEEDDWGIGFKLTECKATSEPLDKPKNCSICMRNSMVFHRHSYYCRRCAQLYRAIHRKKTNLQNEIDTACVSNMELNTGPDGI